MKTKNSSVIFNLSSKMVAALPIVDQVYLHYGKECVITSAKDGKHMEGSKHNSDGWNKEPSDAIDTRTFYFNKETRIKVAGTLQSQLGINYDVVLESNHIHIEYDPD